MKKYVTNLEYKPVLQSADFFEGFAVAEKEEFKDNFSIDAFLNFIINRICFGLLRFVEFLTGIKFYVPIDKFLLKGTSLKTGRLIVSLSKKGIIKQIIKEPRIYWDEPWIIRYRVEVPNSFPEISSYSDGWGSSGINGGGDFDEERALMKAVGEGIERFCLCVYREKNLLLSSYNNISRRALNPFSFVGISNDQRKKDSRLKMDEKTFFRWKEGFSLLTGEKVLIPAQLIYLGYNHHPEEAIIRQQLSTGAAAADSLEKAFYKGICEAVERDAFIIFYLNRLSLPIIDVEAIEDQEIQDLLKMFRRYNLEIYLVDITTDIAIPTIMAIVIDRTGLAQAVHVTTHTDLNVREAIKGAIFEAVRIRVSFRGIPLFTPDAIIKRKILENDCSQIKTFTDRCLFWSPKEMIEKLEFMFCGPKKIIKEEEINKYKDSLDKEKLKIVLNLLKGKKIDIYGVDITTPQIKEEGIYAAKVISPQLQPLYLDEGLKHIDGERLFSVPVSLGYHKKSLAVEELNPIPHPFL